MGILNGVNKDPEQGFWKGILNSFIEDLNI